MQGTLPARWESRVRMQEEHHLPLARVHSGSKLPGPAGLRLDDRRAGRASSLAGAVPTPSIDHDPLDLDRLAQSAGRVLCPPVCLARFPAFS